MSDKLISKKTSQQLANLPSVASQMTATIVDHNALVMASGNKGGAGKSTYLRSYAEALLELGITPTILEADDGNSDVGKFFDIENKYKLNNPEGFELLFDAIERSSVDKPILLSLPGGVDEKAEEHSPGFFSAVADWANATGRNARVAWVIDDKRDGLESLRSFRRTYPELSIDIVRNLFYGSPAAFAFFDASNIRKDIVDSGGRIIDLPALAGRVARQLLIKRWNHDQARQQLGFLDRRSFEAWWNLFRENLRTAGLLP